VDRLVGPRPGEKVSTGMALKAAILNALGFVASPLYLFGHFFQGKPTELLLGPGITPDLLSDDRMGRMLDTLHAAGVTEVFLEVAREAQVLGRYKDQTRTVERGFRLLKDPLFFSGGTLLKRPERVMALALWVYATLGLPALHLGAPGLAGGSFGVGAPKTAGPWC